MPRRNGTGIDLLADPTRRRIVALLATRPRRSSAIARELGMSRPGTTRQLRLSEEAGLIVGHRSPIDGRGVLYTLDSRRTGSMLAWLAGTEVGLTAVGPVRGRPAARSEADSG